MPAEDSFASQYGDEISRSYDALDIWFDSDCGASGKTWNLGDFDDH